MTIFRKGDTFTIAGNYEPLTRSERAQNGWRRRRHKRLIRPHVLKVYSITDHAVTGQWDGLGDLVTSGIGETVRLTERLRFVPYGPYRMVGKSAAATLIADFNRYEDGR